MTIELLCNDFQFTWFNIPMYVLVVTFITLFFSCHISLSGFLLHSLVDYDFRKMMDDGTATLLLFIFLFLFSLFTVILS